MSEEEADLLVLETRRDNLYSRLEAGYTYIESLIEAGSPSSDAEYFWVKLLRQYERVCDEIQREIARGCPDVHQVRSPEGGDPVPIREQGDWVASERMHRLSELEGPGTSAKEPGTCIHGDEEVAGDIPGRS